MKISNYLIQSIIFLLSFNLPLFSGDIDFNISLNKKSFLEREPIWVKCQVKNNGSTPRNVLSIKHTTIRGMVFYLISEDPNTYLQDVSLKYSYGYELLTILNPGESMESFANILEYYSSPSKSLLSGTNIFSLNPGRYKLYTRYYTRWYEKDGREDIYSDTLEFEVIPPIGEEKEALKLLEESNYKEVFERYPGSVYAPLSLYRYFIRQCVFSQREKQRKENVNELLMQQLERYPDSPTIKYIDLQIFLQSQSGIGMLKEGKSRIKSILEKNPNSYAAKMIKEILESTENKSTYTAEDIIEENR